MRPGKRNCERLRQSAWRGQYWQTVYSLPSCVLCVPPPLCQLVCALSVWDDPPHPPHSFVSVFSPLCAVCLTFFTYLSHFPCTHSVYFPSLLCRHTLLHKHPFSLLPTHLWLQASTVLLSVRPLSLTGANLCLLLYHKPLAVMLHMITFNSVSYQLKGSLLKKYIQN